MVRIERLRGRSTTLQAAVSFVLVIAAAALVACGGGGPEAQAASCEGISGIQSYRYSINLRFNAPAFDQSQAQPAPSNTPAPPVSAFAEALEALFSDLKLEGAFQAPDRTQVVMRFKSEELEMREVGGKSWIRVGTVWHEQAPNEEQTILTPSVVCKDIVEQIAPSLAEVDSERETINSIETEHFRLDKTAVGRLPELLGAAPDAELPDKFRVDVWLAREGRFPVRLDIGAEDQDEQGNPIDLSLFMDFRDLNDPAIQIDAPVAQQVGS